MKSILLMKNHKIQFITIILAILFCGFYAEGSEIQNASGGAMPIPRTQKYKETQIYTAFAKKGFTFAVKNDRIIYMSKTRATKLGAKQYSTSHTAEASVKTAKKRSVSSSAGL